MIIKESNTEKQGETVQVNFSIPRGLLARLDSIAERNHRSRSGEISFRVEQSLDAEAEV